MIEQTELIVTEWNYYPPATFDEATDKILSFTSLDVMKKRAPTKKGIACRFTMLFCYRTGKDSGLRGRRFLCY